jgi:hypothetical protein
MRPLRGLMKRRVCPASRTIYVPMDTSIRMAVVIPDHTQPHNHPMPLFLKVSQEAKAHYSELTLASGLLGATVKKVDNCSTFSLSPAEFLHNTICGF